MSDAAARSTRTFNCTIHVSNIGYAITSKLPNKEEFVIAAAVYPGSTLPQLLDMATTRIDSFNRGPYAWLINCISTNQQNPPHPFTFCPNHHLLDIIDLARPSPRREFIFLHLVPSDLACASFFDATLILLDLQDYHRTRIRSLESAIHSP